MCRRPSAAKSRPRPVSSKSCWRGCGRPGAACSPSRRTRLRFRGRVSAMVPDFLTIAEAARLIETKALSPVELVDSRLARIERLDGKLHSFIRVLADSARTEARAAEAEIA